MSKKGTLTSHEDMRPGRLFAKATRRGTEASRRLGGAWVQCRKYTHRWAPGNSRVKPESKVEKGKCPESTGWIIMPLVDSGCSYFFAIHWIERGWEFI